MVRVLIAVEVPAYVRESVVAGAASLEAALRKLKLPKVAEVDLEYAPVPIGRVATTHGFLIEELAYDALESEYYAVRAFVDEKALPALERTVGPSRVFVDPDIEALPACAGDGPVGGVQDVQTNLGVSTLRRHGLTGSRTAIAVVDNGINVDHLWRQGLRPRLDNTVAWQRPVGITPQPGRHPVHHGTMCAYDAVMIAPDATLLDYPILDPTPVSPSGMGGALSNALMAYSHLLSWWAVEFGPTRKEYDALVVTNSWGVYHPSWDFEQGHPGRYIDNPAHPFNQVVASLCASGADIIFAAGNCGYYCPDGRCEGRTAGSIMGANALEDVLCVGGVDTNDQWVGYSSTGPAIPGMDLEKPDVTAYTHFLGSRSFGADAPDAGTSAACPVAAGCVAALRTGTDQSSTSPGRMLDTLERTAHRPSGQAYWDDELGNGIIDPVAAARSFGLI